MVPASLSIISDCMKCEPYTHKKDIQISNKNLLGSKENLKSREENCPFGHKSGIVDPTRIGAQKPIERTQIISSFQPVKRAKSRSAANGCSATLCRANLAFRRTVSHLARTLPRAMFQQKLKQIAGFL